METDELKNCILSEYSDRFSSVEEAELFYETANAHILSANNYINLDVHDLISTLKNSDKINITSIEGPMDAIPQLLTEAHARLQAKKGDMNLRMVMMQLQFDRNSGFTIDKTAHISDFMSSLGPDVDIIWGAGFDDTLGKNVRFTLIEGFKA